VHPTSIVDLRTQSRKDLKIFGAIGVFSIIRDLDIFVPSLLLCLPHFHPLLSRQMLTELGKNILRQPEALKERAICNRIQDDVIIWAFPD
jgi:hypothetical protein